nr:MAG TPA: hypothetical protein [Caudoviricetes sp.]
MIVPVIVPANTTRIFRSPARSAYNIGSATVFVLTATSIIGYSDNFLLTGRSLVSKSMYT